MDASQDYLAPVDVQTAPEGARRLHGNVNDAVPALPISQSPHLAGVIDVRARVSFDSLASIAANTVIVARSEADPNRSWQATIGNAANSYRLSFTYWPTGLAASSALRTAIGTPTLTDGGVTWLRWVFTPDNGAAGNDFAAYQSADGITWSQIGATVTTATAATIYNATSAYYKLAGGAVFGTPMSLYEVQVRDGLNGPNVVPALPEHWDRYSSSAPSAAVQGSPLLTLVNASHPGANIAYLVNAARLKKMTPNYGQTLAVLSAGHNQSTSNGQGLLAEYDAWRQAVAAQLPNVPIVSVTQNPEHPAAATGSPANHAKRRLDLLRYGQANRVEVVDTFGAFLETADWQTALLQGDGIHPSVAGSQVWATELLSRF
jgi:lysophospholipase L1-like esterase